MKHTLIYICVLNLLCFSVLAEVSSFEKFCQNGSVPVGQSRTVKKGSEFYLETCMGIEQNRSVTCLGNTFKLVAKNLAVCLEDNCAEKIRMDVFENEAVGPLRFCGKSDKDLFILKENSLEPKTSKSPGPVKKIKARKE